MKTWRCPKCGAEARTHKAVKEAVCTRHIARRPVRMVEDTIDDIEPGRMAEIRDPGTASTAPGLAEHAGGVRRGSR